MELYFVNIQYKEHSALLSSNWTYKKLLLK